MTNVSEATARERRDAGQQLSIYDMREVYTAAFMSIVASIPAGVEFTVNEIRAVLDAADIPRKARGALMAAACTRGLAEPVVIDYKGKPAAIFRPSTGDTAHAAAVRLYRRPLPNREGR